MPGIARRRHVFEGRALIGLVLGAVMGLVLAGCTSDGSGTGSGALKVAQARVSAKEKALTAAKAEFTSASAAFCGDSSTYITALDRYGDVLHQTAPTVGDVTTAGADLAAPREDVVAAAEAAVAAQQAVADAKQELAAAEAALAAAQSPSASTTSSPKATTSPKPLVPAATANRVKEAEAQLATAQQGITDETPLAQASEQFNAAVVALEMSWLQLFADAGCLTDEQQVQAEAAVRDYTRALQKSLKEAGYFKSEVDGVYGPDTVDAVETLQKTHSLPVTGTVDKATADRTPGRPCGEGRRRRAGGRGVDLCGPADAQARRVLGRAGRRGVDTGPDRGAEGVPDRARCQALGGGRRRDRGCPREGPRRARPAAVGVRECVPVSLREARPGRPRPARRPRRTVVHMIGLLLLSPVAMLFLVLGLDSWERRMAADHEPEQDA